MDLDLVESVFVDAVVDQAEMKNVAPDKIALILFPVPIKRGLAIRVKIFSLNKAFPTEIVKLRKITMYDLTGHISKAIMKILESEVDEHNMKITNFIEDTSTKSVKEPIKLEDMECYIQVEAGEKPKLKMTLINKHRFLRLYDIKEEFGSVTM